MSGCRVPGGRTRRLRVGGRPSGLRAPAGSRTWPGPATWSRRRAAAATDTTSRRTSHCRNTLPETVPWGVLALLTGTDATVTGQQATTADGPDPGSAGSGPAIAGRHRP
jgi:hypothetical protein